MGAAILTEVALASRPVRAERSPGDEEGMNSPGHSPGGARVGKPRESVQTGPARHDVSRTFGIDGRLGSLPG